MNIFNVGKPKITGEVPYEEFDSSRAKNGELKISSIINSIEIYSIIDDVIVNSGGSELSYDYTGGGEVFITPKGDALKVRVKHKNSEIFNSGADNTTVVASGAVTIINGVVVTGGGMHNKVGVLTLNIPTSINFLKVHNDNGSVNVSGRYLDDLLVKTVNGSATLTDCDGAFVATVNGSVYADNCFLTVETVNGNIQLMGGAGVVKTVNGSVRTNAEAYGQYKITTVNGVVN